MRELVGREVELDGAAVRITQAIGGDGGALLYAGEAGVGKTALLDAIAELAGDRMTIVRLRGVEDEMGFSWNGVTPVIRPLLEVVESAAIPPVRRQILTETLAQVDDGRATSIDLYSLSLALHDLVTTAASRKPVLLLIDDLQWIDPASSRALAFVGRRLDHEYVALIATARFVEPGGSIPAAALTAPSPAHAQAILVQHGVSSASVRGALIDAVGTNPLLLLSSLDALDAEVRRGSRPLPDPLHFPATVMDGARRRIAALSDQSRIAVAALAVLGNPSLQQARRMVASLDTDLGCLEEAERTGLISIDETIRFTHPTFRTAAYHGVSAPDRRRLHGLAAANAHDPVASAMHLAAATIDADEPIARRVEATAELLARRGAAAVAAAQYARAAQLSPLDEEAARRRLRGAELYLDLGLIQEAVALLDEQESQADAVGLALARARLLHLQERDDDACRLLSATADTIIERDPGGAARLLVECLAPMVREGRLDAVLGVAAQLHSLEPRLTGTVALRARAIGAVFALFSGGTWTSAIASIDALLEAEGPTVSAPFVAEVVAPILAYANRGGELGSLLDAVERTLRDRAAIVPLISVLAAQQLRNFGVDQPRSIGAGEEAIRLADEIGRPRLAMMAAFGLSIGAAAAGDALGYHRAASLLATSTYPHAEAARLTGLGVLHLTAGRLDDALNAWEALIDLRGFGDPLLTFEADYVETLWRLGRVDDARAMTERFTADGLVQRSPGTLGRVIAMITDDDEIATGRFAAAIDVCRAGNNRIGEGRAELAWGERLRRKRRRAEARIHLERSADLFRLAGLAVWSSRADAELQASGAAIDTSLPVHALLTSQELRVARLVAGGASNRDIGLDLFVSQRTVESHLTTIFRKLGLKNRRELAARAIDDIDLRS